MREIYETDEPAPDGGEGGDEGGGDEPSEPAPEGGDEA